ncbi:gamma-glutamylcyclotransferase family protein, partial [Achromobacter xylosoxidans]|uniref:gamma-glutamylcyclotransferase family protein n=1 Tax=Alcaligenes xylosoxydans xylosoxydans TaxID=85698 RepID=UPI001F12ED95
HQRARHLGAATVPGALVDFGDWPGLLPVRDGRRVRGDIYAVCPALLALMDEIEEYAPGRPGCFVRRPVLARP